MDDGRVTETTLRPHAEQEHQAELAALAVADDRPRPPGWRLSPWAVTTYLLGGEAGLAKPQPIAQQGRSSSGNVPPSANLHVAKPLQLR